MPRNERVLKMRTFMTKSILSILCLILILLVGGYCNLKPINNNPKDRKILKVAFPSASASSAYEPTKINIDYEYIFLENIYSPLVEIDVTGTIQPGIAEKVFWNNDELHLEIRSNLQTASGNPITIDDVIFSLKRLLILSGNTHGNFKDLICGGVDLTSLAQACPGLKKSGNTLILKSTGGKSFLLPMLAAIDFAIIPKSSVNLKTLAIENYRETSGPYYVDTDNGKGEITLKLNQNHYHASSDIATEIKLIPFANRNSSESLSALIKGEVDLLTTVDAARADEQIEAASKYPDEFQNYLTQKIRCHLLIFTEKGIQNLTVDERRYIAQKVRMAFTEIYGRSPGFETREEFFPSLGEGGLSDEMISQIHRLNKIGGNKPKNNFKLGLIRRGGIESWSIPIHKYLPQAQSYFEDNAPDLKRNLKSDDIPEAFIVSTDTGFMEDIGLISYSLNAGLLGLKKSDRSDWLAKYMTTENKKERLSQLKALHFEALASPWIVPLMASPYSATVRKPWQIKLSDLYANNQLWHIKMQ